MYTYTRDRQEDSEVSGSFCGERGATPEEWLACINQNERDAIEHWDMYSTSSCPNTRAMYIIYECGADLPLGECSFVYFFSYFWRLRMFCFYLKGHITDGEIEAGCKVAGQKLGMQSICSLNR